MVDTSEEKLKSTFKGVKRSYIPINTILRIDEVDKKGTAKISKNKNAKVLKVKFKIEGRLFWKKRPGLFFKVDAGTFIPEILLEASDPNGKNVFYKVMESTCPWKFKLGKSKNILSIRGKVPASVKERSCSIKISPFTEEKKGETLVLKFDIKRLRNGL